MATTHAISMGQLKKRVVWLLKQMPDDYKSPTLPLENGLTFTPNKHLSYLAKASKSTLKIVPDAPTQKD